MGVDSPILEEQRTRPGERQTPRQILPIVATIGVCLIAGTCNWLIEKPGESLLWPMAVDVIIFAFFGTLCRLVSALRGTRFGRIGLSSIFLGLGIASLLWTYFGVLAASVGFDSAGASVARHEVAQAARVVERHHSYARCRSVKQGSIGMIQAPYKICTYVIPRSSMVEFATLSFNRGYAYVSGAIGEGWFSDECTRHLTGHWWAFARDQQAPVTGCPFGYLFQPGG
jgi:hypothetical protein